jgi:hypothetical protein
MVRSLLLVVALGAAGCSAPAPAPNPGASQPVRGRVIYDGKPAAGVAVTLLPIDAPMVPQIPHNPRAVTGADGTFVLGTFTDTDGAAEGGYQILLHWPGEKNEKAEGEGEEDTDRLKGWYDGLHSQLNYRVKPGENAIPDLVLPKVTAAPPPSAGIPGRN